MMKSIVIIDDHPAMRMAIRALLEKDHEFRVEHEAGSGLEGLSFLKKKLVDLVILDLELPDMDGFEVLKRIKRDKLQSKILFLSAKNEDVYAARAMKGGAHGYISKDKDLADIVQAVELVLSGYSFFPQSAMHSLYLEAHPSENSAFASLSNRELMIARLLAQGLSNLDIARQLAISNKTVSTYKARIFQKLNVRSLVELAQQVREHAAG
ncbi:DNA-binding response regulator [Xenophilus sp. AP218F]|nr:DNA-binding response regulator [Xenophilus sp. AP218F]